MNTAEFQIPDSLHCTMPDSIANPDWYGAIGDGRGWFGALGNAAGEASDTITAETVYGASSHLSDLSDPSELVAWAAANYAALTDNIVFKLSVIVCFVAFCLLMYFFRGQILGIFSIFRGTGQTEKMVGQQSRVFDIFLGWTVTLGLLVLGMTAIKFAELAAGPQLEEALPEWATLLMVPTAWALCALIFGYQILVLKIAGAITLTTAFTSRLFFLKRIVLALTTIMLTPAVLIFVLSRGASAGALLWIVSIIVGGMVVFLIIRTFMLFMRQNLSISLWFLYLCAVEIFPASLIWIIAGRIL